MSDNPDHGDEFLARRISSEAFLPALQSASRDARAISENPANLLNGAVMAFGEMLIGLVGQGGTVHLLRGLADHIERGGPAQ